MTFEEQIAHAEGFAAEYLEARDYIKVESREIAWKAARAGYLRALADTRLQARNDTCPTCRKVWDDLPAYCSHPFHTHEYQMAALRAQDGDSKDG